MKQHSSTEDVCLDRIEWEITPCDGTRNLPQRVEMGHVVNREFGQAHSDSRCQHVHVSSDNTQ